MNKTTLLFQMMERPLDYTEQQWQEILADEECRELYQLMSKTQSAYDMRHEISDEEIDSEWRRLKRHDQRRWIRIAAMFVGVLMLTGVSFAAIHLWNLSSNHSQSGEGSSNLQDKNISARQHASLSSQRGAGDEATVVFDNVTLDSILPQIASHYGYDLRFRTDKSKMLRLFLTWNPQDSIQRVAEKLNLFEQIHIELEEKTIIVE